MDTKSQFYSSSLLFSFRAVRKFHPCVYPLFNLQEQIGYKNDLSLMEEEERRKGRRQQSCLFRVTFSHPSLSLVRVCLGLASSSSLAVKLVRLQGFLLDPDQSKGLILNELLLFPIH